MPLKKFFANQDNARCQNHFHSIVQPDMVGDDADHRPSAVDHRPQAGDLGHPSHSSHNSHPASTPTIAADHRPPTFREYLATHARVPLRDTRSGTYGPFTFEGRAPLDFIVTLIDKILANCLHGQTVEIDGVTFKGAEDALGAGPACPGTLKGATITVGGGAQFGKTVLILNFQAFATFVEFINFGYYTPDQELLAKIVDTKFRPDVLDQQPWMAEMVQLGRAENASGRAVNRKNSYQVSQGGRKSFGHFCGMQKPPTTISLDAAALDEVDDIPAPNLADCKNSKQLWECTCEIQNQLGRRRRDECRLGHLKLRQARWDHEATAGKEAAEQAAETERRRQMLAYFKLQPNLAEEARQRGNTDWHRDVAAFVLELEHKLKIGILGRKSKEFATDEYEEFDEIATRDEQAPGPEGRVTRVPNPIPTAPAPSPTPCAATVDSRSPQHAAPIPPSAEDPLPSAPIALANDCTPEEFTARSDTPAAAKTRTNRCRFVPTPLSAYQSPALKVEQTGTNS